jgi:hypothetical protein
MQTPDIEGILFFVLLVLIPADISKRECLHKRNFAKGTENSMVSRLN